MIALHMSRTRSSQYPSRSSRLRKALRYRRTASAFSRTRRSEGFSYDRRRFISRNVPSRCIFLFKTRIAAFTSLSRTKTCICMLPFCGRGLVALADHRFSASEVVHARVVWFKDPPDRSSCNKTGQVLLEDARSLRPSRPSFVATETQPTMWQLGGAIMGPASGHRTRMPRTHISRNPRSLRECCGCLSLRSVFASICRIRSRVTENCFPTSSKV